MFVQSGYVEGIMPHSYQNPWSEFQETYFPYYEMGHHEESKAIPTSILDLDEIQTKYIPHPQENMATEHSSLSAIGKTSSLMDAFGSKWDDNKPIIQWSPDDVVEWLCAEARKNNFEVEVLRLDNFRVDGYTLLSMREQDFLAKDPVYGYGIFIAFERRKCMEEGIHRTQIKREEDSLTSVDSLPRPTEQQVLTELPETRTGCPYPMQVPRHPNTVHSDADSDHSDCSVPETKQVIIKKPVGRPRKPGRPKRGNKEKKTGRLWEFIRDLLLNREYCPSLICWENHDEGVFRFVRSDKVAELWGTIKENPKMTYEKLSRAMRYYYKSKVLQPVLGRRLVYKFGPTARGWRTSNPNFREAPK